MPQRLQTRLGKACAIVAIVPESRIDKVRGYAEEIKEKKLPKDAKPEKPDKEEDFKSSL